MEKNNHNHHDHDHHYILASLSVAISAQGLKVAATTTTTATTATGHPAVVPLEDREAHGGQPSEDIIMQRPTGGCNRSLTRVRVLASHLLRHAATEGTTAKTLADLIETRFGVNLVKCTSWQSRGILGMPKIMVYI